MELESFRYNEGTLDASEFENSSWDIVHNAIIEDNEKIRIEVLPQQFELLLKNDSELDFKSNGIKFILDSYSLITHKNISSGVSDEATA